MKKLLVVFAKEFPYGVSEPFLELEYPLYKDYFDKVLIVTNKPKSNAIRGEKTRTVDDPVIEIVESEFNKNFLMKLKFAAKVLTDSNFYKETFSIIKSGKKIKGKIKSLFSVIGKANLCVGVAHKRIRELENEGCRLCAAYGYWLVYPAYSAVKLSKKYYGGKLYTVSRAHSFDLYAYRHATGYLPCRKYILEGLSEIASISEDGENYLRETYPDYKMNITIRRLGAKNVGEMQTLSNDQPVMRIVSCARVVPVKRIDRIVDALMKIHGFNIEWTHVGGGDLLDGIKQKAESLPENVTAVFTGTIPNTDVYERYNKIKYHAFVNVSESEGVPVSIMESMCFGTPVIATNVGGVREMVEHGVSGYLLDENYDDDDLVRYLTAIHDASPDDYQAMRAASRDIFEKKYDAVTNYKEFLKHLSEK